MDQKQIDFIVAAHPTFEPDDYLDDVVAILTTKPTWLHPIKRVKFNREFEHRVRVVFSVYARDLVTALK